MTRRSTPLGKAALAVAVLATVSGCAYPGQNQYESYNVGHPIPVLFGSIVAARPIAIKGQPTGLAAGAIAEQALIDHPGVEYTVVLQSGQTYMLAQNLNPGDRILQPGERVMVQQGYGYMRVLPADNVPTDVQRPPGLDVH